MYSSSSFSLVPIPNSNIRHDLTSSRNITNTPFAQNHKVQTQLEQKTLFFSLTRKLASQASPTKEYKLSLLGETTSPYRINKKVAIPDDLPTNYRSAARAARWQDLTPVDFDPCRWPIRSTFHIRCWSSVADTKDCDWGVGSQSPGDLLQRGRCSDPCVGYLYVNRQTCFHEFTLLLTADVPRWRGKKLRANDKSI